MTHDLRITGGLYLVIDPAPGSAEVLPGVEAALRGGVDVLQIWDHWQDNQDQITFVEVTCELARKYGVPVLINENIDLLKKTHVHGIHFDTPAIEPQEIRTQLNRPILYGITCGNDLSRIRWAAEQKVDYISFCAMYPSPSVDTCDIVSLDTVRQAREIVSCPIFASGGVTPDNLAPILEKGADGIAVISGILKTENPTAAARQYKEQINELLKNREEYDTDII